MVSDVLPNSTVNRRSLRGALAISKRNSPADLPAHQPMSDTARNPNNIDLHQLLWLSEDRVTR
jgi:hypothetical protein